MDILLYGGWGEWICFQEVALLANLPNQANNRYEQKQRQKQKVTGSSSRIIEVWVCSSSEWFKAAALSEHAPDEVSQGGEWAVITGRLERRSISETALRGVRCTRRSCRHAKRAGYKQIEQPRWQTTIQGPFSVTFFPSLVFSIFTEGTGSEGALLTA